jgi:FSR family fosmidomycin resistance protein-like MFS transporter
MSNAIIEDQTKTSSAAVSSTSITSSVTGKTIFPILLAISFSHLLNDTIQSLIPSTYPLLKRSLHLDFSQLGLITFCFQLTASILQPFVGLYTDRRPKPYSLAAGMCFTLVGLVLLSQADSFPLVLFCVSLVGLGSAIFHPESSRVAYLASGGRRGMAQSLFQVGGNAGSALGPLLAALIIAPYGQSRILWFSLAALLAIAILIRVGGWYKKNRAAAPSISKSKSPVGSSIGISPVATAISRSPATSSNPPPAATSPVTRQKLVFSLAILLVLIFSKYFYMASMTSYYIFYLMDKFHLSIQNAHRRSRRGSHRQEICNLVLYPGGGAFHPALALQQSFLDQYTEHFYWGDPGIGFFRDPGICPGSGAG